MAIAWANFDWDAGNRAKCQKHGLTIVEIEAFLLSDPLIAPDLRHSIGEQRFLAVGRNSRGRALFVVFTLRQREGETLIRPLSARYMHEKEIERYEAKEH